MNEPADDTSIADLAEAARSGALKQARMIFRAIFTSPVGRRVIALLAGLVVAILVTSLGTSCS